MGVNHVAYVTPDTRMLDGDLDTSPPVAVGRLTAEQGRLRAEIIELSIQG
jgi:hypothetical protein